MKLPTHVNIVEVGPRDGLQSETQTLDTAFKIEMIEQLAQTGLPIVEITSFSSPKWVPQMADHLEVLRGIKRLANVQYPVIVPTANAMEKALANGATDVSILISASETFAKRNTNCSVAESLARAQAIIALATHEKIPVRAYLSCAIACPYEGAIAPTIVAELAKQLIQLGCYQVSLSDTIGVATPKQVHALFNQVLQQIAIEQCAVHFHDTYGQAIANIYTALTYGVSTIDAAVAGLGGCPYAPGAAGNVATEDVVYLLNGLGIDSGVDLAKLAAVGHKICQRLGRPPVSKVSRALKKNKTP